jgi:hypothetical protein
VKIGGFPLAILVVSIAVAPLLSAQDNINPRYVSAGTRFLASLQDTLSTKDLKAGDHFQVRTLEPLVTPNGETLRPGAEIRGHVDKVEQAHKTGRAKLWLTFDDVKTPEGWLPLVAVVDDVPGVHSLRVDNQREGEIEMQRSKRQDEEAAIAAGAFVGAAAGVAARNGKDAALGAAAGAATAFMAVSGLGEELTLAKDTKLELMLERDLPL